MKELIWKYIIGPIIADAKNAETAVWEGITAHTGYNPVNTVTWGLIALASIFLIRRQFRKKDVELKTSTAISSLPFIVLGGILRFLEDAAVLPFVLRPLVITPVIYFVAASVFLISLYLARELASQSSFERDDILKNIGYVVLSPFLALATFILVLGSRTVVIFAPIIISVVLTGIYYFFSRNTDYSRNEYVLAVFSQLFGGATSMISLSYGYEQKQILTQAFTSIFGESGVLILKSGIALLGVYIIEEDLEDEMLKALALIVFYSIGIATGLRVLLRLGVGI